MTVDVEMDVMVVAFRVLVKVWTIDCVVVSSIVVER